MDETVTHNSIKSPKPETIFILLILVSLIIPHTLGIRRQSSHIRFTLVAALWTVIHESGSTIAGPYSYTLFPFPNDAALLWTAIFIPLQLCISYVVFQSVKGTTEKETALCVVVIALVIQAFLAGALWFAFDGLRESVLPLPVFHLVSLFVVQRNVR
ncbi:MAG: hypothetical protein AM324_004655 [Candidatus Thorarchaeota archaeon SMTZ1-83]|nr:MAG: hypothetical protein AM324_05775 [Candidatus Thorarchaeota archaeon SMTZ1-83]